MEVSHTCIQTSKRGLIHQPLDRPFWTSAAGVVASEWPEARDIVWG